MALLPGGVRFYWNSTGLKEKKWILKLISTKTIGDCFWSLFSSIFTKKWINFIKVDPNVGPLFNIHIGWVQYEILNLSLILRLI